MKNTMIKTGICCLAALPASLVHAYSNPNRPNIVCIVAEDISPYLGCYGDPVAKTPHLDHLASQSIRYTNMHTPNGVSAPSRFALITGMYPSSLGGNYMRASYRHYEVVLPEYIKAYTEYLRAAGYFCTNNAKTDYQIGTAPSQWDENNKQATWENCPDGQSFFSIFNLNTTHESQLWSRKDEPFIIKPEEVDMSRFPYFPDDPVIRQDLARMYTNIAIMDGETQALINKLEKAGKLDNTIIIWYSDNGGPIPRGKRSIYNTGTNVPFMVRFPNGYRAGEVDDRLCTFMDIPATILSLAGIKVPEYMHGRAFFGEQELPQHECIFAARDRYDNVSDHSASARDKRFHYVRNYMPETGNYLDNDYRLSLPMMKRLLELRDEGKLNEQQMLYFKAPRPIEEFYDLENDPYELHNLADDPVYKQDFDRLKTAFTHWNNTLNKDWNTKTEDDWIAEFKPDNEQRIVNNPTIRKTDKGYVVLCSTPGVSFIYKIGQALDDTDKPNNKPPKGWKYYTGAIQLKAGETLTVMGCRAGYKSSDQITIE